MRMSEVDFGARLPIDGYGPGFFRVGGEVYRGHLAILGGEVAAWPGLSAPEPLLHAAGDLDLVLVGTGATLTPPPAPFRAALEDAGLALEPMATDAACRTYNVLLAEGRRVGAALLTL
ncbi:MAG: Mth938-like domain-containing protein [Pseudomonadota bacterium]